jgi:phosphatidylinositol glycan class B
MRIRDANSDQPKNKQLLFSWSTLFCVVLLATIIRVINALLLQTQFDPDEYWQNLEPAYCMAFHEKGYSCHMTWEWTRRAPSSVHGWMERLLRGPARSYVAILPTYWLYAIVQIPGWDFPWMISKGPLFLNAVLVAAPVDVSIWIAAHFIPASKMMYSNDLANISLFFSLTSWFQGYALIRTYSNSLEAMLLAVGVALVSPVSCSSE